LILRSAFAPGRRLPSLASWAVISRTAALSWWARRLNRRQRSLALPVVEVADFAVALELGSPPFAALSPFTACVRLVVEALIAASVGGTAHALALIGEIREGALSGPVVKHARLRSLRAILSCTVTLPSEESIAGKKGSMPLTRLSNRHLDIPSLELSATEIQGLLEAFQRSKLNVSETFRLLLYLIFNNADVGDRAPVKEVMYITFRDVVGQIAKMGRERRLSWERELLARGISSVSTASFCIAC
jgi:hypothetical protein